MRIHITSGEAKRDIHMIAHRVYYILFRDTGLRYNCKYSCAASQVKQNEFNVFKVLFLA